MDLRAEAPADKLETLVSPDPDPALDRTQRALLDYARKITLEPAACSRADIAALREAGADDTMIHAT
ncbi:MAG: peroxidase-related enzyme, partial [Acidobacteriota bacterium]|nr:peroxidase-related enzyme [Acidobacteriota bacterium]